MGRRKRGTSRRKNKYKDPETGEVLAFSRNSKTTRVTGAARRRPELELGGVGRGQATRAVRSWIFILPMAAGTYQVLSMCHTLFSHQIIWQH